MMGTSPDAILKRLKKHNIDGVNIGDSSFLTQEIIETFTSAGYPVYVWTVNDPERALELLKSGVESVTTDRAAWMAKKLKDKI